jgi:hypothetical protein
VVRAQSTCLIAVLVAAAGVAGCGGTKKEKILDTERIERAIEKRVLDTRHLRTDVSCPSGVQQKKGRVFRCTAAYAGGTTTFEVRQDDDKGSVHYKGLKK